NHAARRTLKLLTPSLIPRRAPLRRGSPAWSLSLSSPAASVRCAGEPEVDSHTSGDVSRDRTREAAARGHEPPATVAPVDDDDTVGILSLATPDEDGLHRSPVAINGRDVDPH